MVNLSRRFKLEYEDAVDGTTIIAETGQDTGAPKIDRHTHIRRTNDADILKLWIEEPDFGNTIPTDRSNFATAQNGENEPEILYKQYDEDANAFVTQGRFYAKNAGSINEEGQLAVKLYSFMRYTAKQDVNASSTIDLEDAMNQVLPPGYVADTLATTPNVEGYSVSSRREKGYHELTRNYAFALTFTAELDANNDYKVKFEPVGFGGSVDTLVDRNQGGRYPIIDVDTTNNVFVVQGDKTTDLVVGQSILVDGSTGNDGTYEISALNYDATNNETDITVSQNVSDATADGSILPGGTAKFKSWEKDKTDSVVNKVVIEGTNANGVKVTGTADNLATQNKVGVKKKGPIKVGYLANATEGNEIAKSYLVPGKDSNGNDIEELPESGRIKTTVYSDNVVNDSFQIISNRLNIDNTYTCAQQRNYWPEGATEIDFEFEQEGLEEAARDTENLRDERARLLPSNQTDVGNQNINSDTNNSNADLNRDQDVVATGSDGPNKEKAQLQRDPNTSVGQVETELGYFVGAYNEDITNDNGNGWVSTDFFVILDADDYLFNAAFPSIQVTVERLQTGPQRCEVFVRIRNRTTGEYFPDAAGVKIMDQAYMSGTTDQQYTVSTSQYLHAPFNWNNNEFELQYNIDVTGLVDAEIFYSYHGSNGHVHDDDIEIERGDTGAQAPEAVLETDPQANITTQPVFTDNGHFHLVDTTTDAKNINITTEDKTDR